MFECERRPIVEKADSQKGPKVPQSSAPIEDDQKRVFAAPDGAKPFAWAGWWLPVPPNYRLHDIDGTAVRGNFVLADPDRVRLEVAWDRVTQTNLNAQRFAERQLRRILGKRFRTSEPALEAIADSSFDHLFLFRDEERSSDYYLGHDANTQLAACVMYRRGTKREDALIHQSLTRHFFAQPRGDGQRWAFFSVSFVAPSGFEYESARLNLGDMAVQLVRKKRGAQPRLVVRKIYPAKLALSRFDLRGWMNQVLEPDRPMYRPRYRRRLAQRDPVLEEAETPLGPVVVCDSRLRPVLRPIVRLRHPVHRRTWVIHDHAHDCLVIVQMTGHPDQFAPTFEELLRGWQWAP